MAVPMWFIIMSAEKRKCHFIRSKLSTSNPHVIKCKNGRNGCQYLCRFVLQTVSSIAVPSLACVPESLGWCRLSIQWNYWGQFGAKTETMCGQVHGQLQGVRATAFTELCCCWREYRHRSHAEYSYNWHNAARCVIALIIWNLLLQDIPVTVPHRT